MLVSQILKVKGGKLYSISADGRVMEAAKVMSRFNMGSLVVFDDRRMVGMLSFKEVLDALSARDGALGDVTVREIMVRDPVAASPGMELSALRRIMLESGARYLPVLDGETVVGVISFRDVAKAVLEEQEFENRMLKGYIKDTP